MEIQNRKENNMNETNFYASLSAAMADINTGTQTNALADSTAAGVKVWSAPTGRPCVVLLTDLSESAQVDVNKSIDLVLNGKTLTLTGTAAYLNFGAGTDCVIDGRAEGSKITSPERDTGNFVVSNGDSLTVLGGTYEANSCYSGYCHAFDAAAGKTKFLDCSMNANNQNNTVSSAGVRVLRVHPGTECLVSGCTVTAEAQKNAYTVMVGGKTTVIGSNISSNSENSQSNAVMTLSGAETCIDGCSLASHSNLTSVYTIANQGSMTVKNSTVHAESTNMTGNNYTCVLHNTDGAQAVVKNTVLSAVSNAAFARTVWNAGNLSVTNCSVSAESNSNIAHSIFTEGNAKTDIRNSAVIANTNSSEYHSYGISNSGILSASCSRVTADAPMKGAIGINNHGICYLFDADVQGIHSGCCNNGHLYVQGGVFTGWTHGGIYFCPGDRPNTEGGETGAGYLNYVSDAYIRCGYSGIHGEALKALQLPFGACGYVGSGTEITVHMDNCTIDGKVAANFDMDEYRAALVAAGGELPQLAPHLIAFRSSMGETNNTLYISNSHVSGGSGKFRIDMAADGSDLGHRLYVGMGTNITSDTVNNRSCAIIGGTDCHRRSKASFKAQLQ